MKKNTSNQNVAAKPKYTNTAVRFKSGGGRQNGGYAHKNKRYVVLGNTRKSNRDKRAAPSAPKPIHLGSLKSENAGVDPTVTLVKPGGWGSVSHEGNEGESSNANTSADHETQPSPWGNVAPDAPPEAQQRPQEVKQQQNTTQPKPQQTSSLYKPPTKGRGGRELPPRRDGFSVSAHSFPTLGDSKEPEQQQQAQPPVQAPMQNERFRGHDSYRPPGDRDGGSRFGGSRYGGRGDRGDRYGDRYGDRGGDRRYGGDRYGDRGDRGDRYGDRGGDRYGRYDRGYGRSDGYNNGYRNDNSMFNEPGMRDPTRPQGVVIMQKRARGTNKKHKAEENTNTNKDKSASTPQNTRETVTKPVTKSVTKPSKPVEKRILKKEKPPAPKPKPKPAPILPDIEERAKSSMSWANMGDDDELDDIDFPSDPVVEEPRAPSPKKTQPPKEVQKPIRTPQEQDRQRKLAEERDRAEEARKKRLEEIKTIEAERRVLLEQKRKEEDEKRRAQQAIMAKKQEEERQRLSQMPILMKERAKEKARLRKQEEDRIEAERKARSAAKLRELEARIKAEEDAERKKREEAAAERAAKLAAQAPIRIKRREAQQPQEGDKDSKGDDKQDKKFERRNPQDRRDNRRDYRNERNNRNGEDNRDRRSGNRRGDDRDYDGNGQGRRNDRQDTRQAREPTEADKASTWRSDRPAKKPQPKSQRNTRTFKDGKRRGDKQAKFGGKKREEAKPEEKKTKLVYKAKEPKMKYVAKSELRKMEQEKKEKLESEAGKENKSQNEKQQPPQEKTSNERRMNKERNNRGRNQRNGNQRDNNDGDFEDSKPRNDRNDRNDRNNRRNKDRKSRYEKRDGQKKPKTRMAYVPKAKVQITTVSDSKPTSKATNVSKAVKEVTPPRKTDKQQNTERKPQIVKGFDLTGDAPILPSGVVVVNEQPGIEHNDDDGEWNVAKTNGQKRREKALERAKERKGNRNAARAKRGDNHYKKDQKKQPPRQQKKQVVAEPQTEEISLPVVTASTQENVVTLKISVSQNSVVEAPWSVPATPPKQAKVFLSEIMQEQITQADEPEPEKEVIAEVEVKREKPKRNKDRKQKDRNTKGNAKGNNNENQGNRKGRQQAKFKNERKPTKQKPKKTKPKTTSKWLPKAKKPVEQPQQEVKATEDAPAVTEKPVKADKPVAETKPVEAPIVKPSPVRPVTNAPIAKITVHNSAVIKKDEPEVKQEPVAAPVHRPSSAGGEKQPAQTQAAVHANRAPQRPVSAPARTHQPQIAAVNTLLTPSPIRPLPNEAYNPPLGQDMRTAVVQQQQPYNPQAAGAWGTQYYTTQAPFQAQGYSQPSMFVHFSSPGAFTTPYGVAYAPQQHSNGGIVGYAPQQQFIAPGSTQHTMAAQQANLGMEQGAKYSNDQGLLRARWSMGTSIAVPQQVMSDNMARHHGAQIRAQPIERPQTLDTQPTSYQDGRLTSNLTHTAVGPRGGNTRSQFYRRNANVHREHGRDQPQRQTATNQGLSQAQVAGQVRSQGQAQNSFKKSDRDEPVRSKNKKRDAAPDNQPNPPTKSRQNNSRSKQSSSSGNNSSDQSGSSRGNNRGNKSNRGRNNRGRGRGRGKGRSGQKTGNANSQTRSKNTKSGNTKMVYKPKAKPTEATK